MSNLIVNRCRPAQMPPTAKSILMAIADRADDKGFAWPSIAGLCEATCYRHTAVIDAVRWLESHHFVTIERAKGRNNRFTINLRQFATSTPNEPVRETDQSATRTSPPNVLVRETDPTRPPDGLPLVRVPDPLVREADTNHQEPSVRHQEPPKKTRATVKPRTTPASELLPDVTEQALADWQQVRKAKRVGAITGTVVQSLRAEASKAGMSVQQVVELCCANGWAGFKAEWIHRDDRAGKASGHAAPSTPETLPWDTNAGTMKAKGMELGVPYTSEDECRSFDVYKRKVMRAIESERFASMNGPTHGQG